MPTFNTLITELGKATGGYFTGTLTAGTTSLLTDTSIDGIGTTFRSANALEGWWVRITSGVALGEVCQVTTYSPSAGTMTPDRTLGNAPSTATYEVFQFDRPEVNNGLGLYINMALQDIYYPTVWFPTLVPDGDMDASGTTNWGTLSGATVAKTTTAAQVFWGERALTVTSTGANGYVQSDNIPCRPSDTFYVEATCKPRTTNDDAIFRIWDVTNAAAIYSSATYARPDWGVLGATTISAPSGCENIAVRLIGVGSNDIIDWDSVIVAGSLRYTWLMSSNFIHAQKVYVERLRGVQDGQMAFERIPGKRIREWSTGQSMSAANPFYLTVSSDGMGAPLAVHFKRKFSTLSAGTDTVGMPTEFVVAFAKVKAYMAMRRKFPTQTQWKELEALARIETVELAPLYSPNVPDARMPRGG